MSLIHNDEATKIFELFDAVVSAMKKMVKVFNRLNFVSKINEIQKKQVEIELLLKSISDNERAHESALIGVIRVVEKLRNEGDSMSSENARLCNDLRERFNEISTKMEQHVHREDLTSLRWLIKSEGLNLFRQIAFLRELQEYTESSEVSIGNLSLRGWAVSPDFLAYLVRYVEASQPRKIIEFGSGATTIMIASYLNSQRNINGQKSKFVSYESDENYANRTKSYLKETGLEEYVDLRIAPLRNNSEGAIWYEFSSQDYGVYELIVVDGPSISFGAEVRVGLLSIIDKIDGDNTTIFIDDANRPGEMKLIDYLVRERSYVNMVNTNDFEKGAAVLVKKVCRL
ncbi:hypothetical protein OAS86_05980 [Gammaproteobacteria bacterium]|nr:hypothetical protein [Gammaproteobacteria bacterium]